MFSVSIYLYGMTSDNYCQMKLYLDFMYRFTLFKFHVVIVD